MEARILQLFSCPACRGSLEQPPGTDDRAGSILSCTACRREWPVRSGIPDFTFPDELRKEDAESRSLWNRIARFYDAINVVTGVMRGVSTRRERRELISGLGLTPGSAVLEVATGTGRNLEFLAEAAGETGRVFAVDLSPRMLDHARRRAEGLAVRPQLSLANSQHLPYRDDAFDAVLDGAGIKYYPDKARAMSEMLRVVRPGGKVLITELGLPPGRPLSLRQRLLRLWIPGFGDGPPCDAVPAAATDVQLDWDAAETFYALGFRKPA